MTLLDWCARQMFRQVHCKNLVYNTCWEDPRCDRAAMEIGPGDEIVMITSAGCNALDYVLDEPARIYCIDMNPRQNALLELKQAAIRHFDYEAFFRMFGEGHLPQAARLYNEQLRADLSPDARQFWDRKIHYFTRQQSFYFKGTTGLFARLANVYINFRKARTAIESVFSIPTVEAREAAYHGYIKHLIWTDFVRRLMGYDSTLSLLGVPKPQRQQIEQSYDGGVARFVEDCLADVFTRVPTQDNYLWWLYLFGYYTRDRCPEYLREENFDRLKGLVDRISTHTTTMLDFLNGIDRPIQRFVLLDHMDWLATYGKPILEAEWQAIADRAAPGARILWRSAALEVDYVDPIRVQVDGCEKPVGELLSYNQQLACELHEKDRVHTYGSFYIADWRCS
ncbi:MAG: BtaA family protein [Gammaproteobacteria bacterium]|nr:BtaA family protein [Gammaproteobacteria bacterium]